MFIKDQKKFSGDTEISSLVKAMWVRSGQTEPAMHPSVMKAVLRWATLEKAHLAHQGKSSFPLLSPHGATTEPCAQFWPPYCMRDAKSNGGHQDGQELGHRTYKKRPKELHLFSLKKGEMGEI